MTEYLGFKKTLQMSLMCSRGENHWFKASFVKLGHWNINSGPECPGWDLRFCISDQLPLGAIESVLRASH